MNRRGWMIACLVVAGAGALVVAAGAQNVPGVVIAAVSGVPFTAEESITWTHQVNGQEVTGHLLATLARDTQGHTRGERHTFGLVAASPQTLLTNVFWSDPVAGTRTDCDYALRLCHIYAFKGPTLAQADDPMGLDALARQGRTGPVKVSGGTKVMSTDSMGSETVDNLLLTGVRRVISPAESGGAASQDASAQSVVEIWYSHDLKQVISETRHYPHGETQVAELRILSQSDPDPALFVVPAGFEMKDERNAVSGAAGKVQQPVLLRSAEPQVSDEARRNKPIDKTVLVTLVVDAQGIPQNVRVMQAAGMGLDEKAVEAVEQYRFRPAMMDGKPVPVELRVQVRFQAY